MAPRLTAANPLLREDLGRVAVERGPLVYCLEAPDQPGLNSIFDVWLPVGAEPGPQFQAEFRPEFLGGVMVLCHPGLATAKPLADEPLYKTFQKKEPGFVAELKLTLIPYYAWANRGIAAMQVWIPFLQGPP